MYSFFLGAVMLSSWISGLGPGILATVLGTLAADYFLLEPLHSVSFDLSRAVQLSAFVLIAVLISSLNDSRRRAVSALAAERSQLEMRVQERTAELVEANRSLLAEIDRRSRSERNFRDLIDAAPDAIIVVDRNGRIVTINHETERMFGYGRDALLGADVETILPHRFRAAPGARRTAGDEHASVRTSDGESMARRADGSEFPVDIRISPLDVDGSPSVVGIVRDVTERYRLQQVQQRLVHDLGERVKELTALHATARVLHQPGEPLALLRQIVETLPDAWQFPEIAAGRIAVAGMDVRADDYRTTPWMQYATFMTPDGGSGLIEVVYLEERPAADEGPFLAEERSLIESLAGLLRAYFERLHAEEDRIKLVRAEAARAEAQQANHAKDQFLATLSHELRSPLNVMLGWTRMLRFHQLEPERVSRGLEILERNVRLQAKLIEDLLDVSRIVTGKLHVELQRIDLAIVAGLAVDAARPAARARNIHLDATIAPAVVVLGDPPRLQQVISNLLTNALKFTPERGRIELTLDAVDERVRIIVRDTGIGIAPELLPLVFDRLQQGDRSTTRTQGGLGLGLAIVKHLIELHNGRIEVASSGKGLGTTVTITLPIVAHEQSTLHAARPPAPDSQLLAGIRVLVVDDEEDARSTLTAILQQYGAQPTSAASAREAFDAVTRDRPDLLLSDIAMPDEDGYVLMRRIRATVDARRLPAAALTAYVADESQARALEAGFQAHLAKPIEPSSLATALAKLLRGVGDAT